MGIKDYKGEEKMKKTILCLIAIAVLVWGVRVFAQTALPGGDVISSDCTSLTTAPDPSGKTGTYTAQFINQQYTQAITRQQKDEARIQQDDYSVAMWGNPLQEVMNCEAELNAQTNTDSLPKH